MSIPRACTRSYGRQFSRWWDVVGGVRQDAGPGAAQTWAAFGVQGLAPYRFEVEATAYVSTEGTIQTRLEAEYDLRVTNRWIVRPLAGSTCPHGRTSSATPVQA